MIKFMDIMHLLYNYPLEEEPNRGGIRLENVEEERSWWMTCQRIMSNKIDWRVYREMLKMKEAMIGTCSRNKSNKIDWRAYNVVIELESHKD